MSDGNSPQSKTLFVGISARYQLLSLVHTGLLPGLLDAGHRLVLLGPAADVLAPYGTALGPSCARHVVPPLAANYLEMALARLIAEQRAPGFPTHRRERWRAAKETLRARSPAHRLYDRAAATIARRLDREQLLDLYWRRSSPEVDALFARYRPDAVLLSWAGAYAPCPTIFRSARRAGCPTMSLDASWDNMDERLLIPRLDHLNVWSEAMRREAIEWHDYRPESVHVVGSVRCDHYRARATATAIDREPCLTAAGLDPARALVTVATNRGDHRLYDDTVAALLRADDAGALARPIQVMLRVAPGVTWPGGPMFDDPRVSVFRAFSTGIDAQSLRTSAALVTHSDVMVSVLSTLILESCFSDTANVSMAYPALDELYERDFVEPVIRTGGFALATSPQAVVSEVAAYLAKPKRHADGRRRLVEEFAGGRSLVAPRLRKSIDAMLLRADATGGARLERRPVRGPSVFV